MVPSLSSRTRRFRTMIWSALTLGLAALVMTPLAAAHPIHGGCGQYDAEVWGEAYVRQLDPQDPASLTSGIVKVTSPTATCGKYWHCDGGFVCDWLPVG